LGFGEHGVQRGMHKNFWSNYEVERWPYAGEKPISEKEKG
jgi:hypothetical protein